MTTWWLGSLGTLLAAPGDVVLDLGPQHPTRAGVVELACEHHPDGRIRSCRVVVGREHRGVEKLFEVRDVRACLSLADRHDWQAPAFGELSLVLSVEGALGIMPPPRATWLRTILAEHSRIHALLGHLSWLETRAGTPTGQIAPLRERLREQQAAWSGSRLHPMVTRIGGVVADVDAQWLQQETAVVRDAAAAARTMLPQVEQVSPRLGPATARDLDDWGLSGPFARAAGVDRDLRRRAPVLAYGDLNVPASRESDGDARARFRVVIDDIVQSARLISEAADYVRAVAGPIDTRLPKIIKLPEGDFYTPLEAPWGEAGIRLVSRGEKTPWRASLRTPSLANVQALEHLLVGAAPHEVEPIVASVGYVIGDVDK